MPLVRRGGEKKNQTLIPIEGGRKRGRTLGQKKREDRFFTLLECGEKKEKLNSERKQLPFR